MSEEEIIAGMKEIDWETFCGIYFLINEGEVVYVGQSVNVMARVAAHKIEGKKKFTHYYFYKADVTNLNECEAMEIVRYNPLYNGNLPPNSMYKEINYFKKLTGFPVSKLRKMFFKKVKTIELMGRLYYFVLDCMAVLEGDQL